jgi:NF-X1-type zinc finger protein NFXL1
MYVPLECGVQVGTGVGVDVSVARSVAVTVGVSVAVGVAMGVLVAVAVGASVGVVVGVVVAVVVRVVVGVTVAVLVAAVGAVAEGSVPGVGVGVGQSKAPESSAHSVTRRNWSAAPWRAAAWLSLCVQSARRLRIALSRQPVFPFASFEIACSAHVASMVPDLPAALLAQVEIAATYFPRHLIFVASQMPKAPATTGRLAA